jgi:hypothetical protein
MQDNNQPEKHTIPAEITSHNCKNCETIFEGKYCPNCGQSTKQYDRPLHFLIVDFAGNVFAFDTRLWLSIKHLLTKPGKFETDYVHGKRRRYMPPFRLYVFVSFVFFLLLGFTTNRSVIQNKELIAKSLLNEGPSDSIPDVAYMSQYFEGKVSPEELATLTEIMEKAAPDSLKMVAPQKPIHLNLKMGEDKIDIKDIASKPEVYLSRFFKYLSWSFFILMPFYGFLLWLFFRKSYKYYFAHFVMATSHHTIVFIAYALVLLSGHYLTVTITNYLSNGFFFLILIYFYMGALRLYKLRWYSVLLRLLTVLLIYSLVSMFATVPVVILALS